MFRVGIIGCNTIMPQHAKALERNPKTTLVVVADIVAERARQAAGCYGCAWCTDYQQMLARADLDAVHICLPHYLHMPVAIEAMRAGKHVFTEKPMAIKPDDARAMIRVSEETGRRLGVCFQNRYNLFHAPVKRALESGETGKILGVRGIVTWHRDGDYYRSAAWRGTWTKEGGGVLINQSIHMLDLLQWYMGRIARVKALTDTCLLSDYIEVEDTIAVVMQAHSGAIALLYATNCHCRTKVPLLELECERAVIRIEDWAEIAWRDGRREVFQGDTQTGDEQSGLWDIHGRIIDDFYDCLDFGASFQLSAREALQTVDLIDAAYRSAQEGGWVELPPFYRVESDFKERRRLCTE